MENIRPRYFFSIATLEAPVPWIKIWYGLQSLSDTGYIPQGICRQPHFLLPVPSWLNPEQPLSGRVNVVAWSWVSATYLVWRQERACLSVPLPADMPRICLSAALNALWKVECWACLAVSLDPALDSLKSKDFPFVRKRNTFWRAQYAEEVSRHDRRVSRLCWSSHILSQGEPYTHFSWGTDSSSGCNPLSVPLSIWNIWFLLAVVWVE